VWPRHSAIAESDSSSETHVAHAYKTRFFFLHSPLLSFFMPSRPSAKPSSNLIPTIKLRTMQAKHDNIISEFNDTLARLSEAKGRLFALDDPTDDHFKAALFNFLTAMVYSLPSFFELLYHSSF
jgi:hypothetical protein